MDLEADKYNNSNKPQLRDGKELIHRIVAENTDKIYDIVLDIGCGSGNITVLLESELKVGHIYGIDVDEEMIGFAKQNHLKDNISYFAQDFGLEFEQLSQELQSLEGKVSLIFSNHCLHWIQNKENVAKNLNRLLIKGAKVYTNIFWISDPFRDLSDEEKAIHEKEFMKIPELQDQFNVWLKLFKSVDFHVIANDFVPKDITLEIDFFKQNFLPLLFNLRRIYFVDKDIEKMKQKSNEMFAKILSECHQFRDKTTEEDMIEFKYGFFQFVLRK